VTNTTNNKNSGNAVLYENVKTIMAIRDNSSLKQLGYNILNKFMLKSTDNNNNNKFAALNLLKNIINDDQQAV
jgi:AP-1 complex subunit gamma-1